MAKKRVQCLNEALGFVSSSVLADSLVLRNSPRAKTLAVIYTTTRPISTDKNSFNNLSRRFKFEVQFFSLERIGLEINNQVFYWVVDLIDPESNRVAGAITSDFLTILIGQDLGYTA